MEEVVENKGMQGMLMNEIFSLELIKFRATTSKNLPSYALMMNIKRDEETVSFIRHGFIRNKKGEVPSLNYNMLADIGGRLVGMNISASSMDYANTIKTTINNLIGDMARDYAADLLSEELINAKIEDGRKNKILSAKARARLRVLRLVIDDTAELISSEKRLSPCYVDGKEIENKGEYLSSIFGSIKDYQSIPLPEKPFVYGKYINQYEDFDDLKLLKKNGTKGYLYYYYALGFGLATKRLSKGSFVAEKHDKSMIFSWSSSQLSSIVSHAFCVDKEATRHLLGERNLPVPIGRAFEPNQLQSAVDYANLIGYPVVCKPLNGSKGEGVVVNIKNDAGLEKAIIALRRSVYKDSDIIVEKFIKGKDYRIVVVGNEVKGALCRELASIEGDGKHSTIELMLAKHAWRMRNPHFIDRSAFIDEENAFGNIDNNYIDLRKIPKKGEHVVFGTSCNLSQGADSVDVMDELHPSIKAAAIDAVKCVPKLRYCGVDMLLEDHTMPIDEQSAAIIELNAKAAIGNCEYPMFGTSREVVKSVFTTVANDFDIQLDEFDVARHKVKCVVRGTLDAKKYISWANSTARSLKVNVDVVSAERKKVIIILEGGLKSVAMMATRLIVGPSSCRPTSVNTQTVS